MHLYESQMKNQQAILQSALNSDELTILAPYKLALVLGKHKMPFSSCSAFLEFARCADPKSVVFSRMPAGRDTITRRTQDLHQRVLKPTVVQGVMKSPCWCLIADESTDSSTHEQLSLFVRYINLQEQKVVEEFLEIKRIVGHPTAANLFTSVMECIEKEAADDSLPTEKLVGLNTDGASVMVSERGGLYGKFKQAVNFKLFLTHCPPHHLILASKAGQKVLPVDIEKTVADVLYFFKDSSVRRDEFHSLKELVEPNTRLCSIIEYGGSHFLIVLVALLNCCPCLLDILRSKRWTLVTGNMSEQNADPSIANCLNQDSNSSCFFWNLN